MCFLAYSTISLSFAPLRPASWAVCASQPRVSKYSFSPAYISSRRSFNVFFLFFLVWVILYLGASQVCLVVVRAGFSERYKSGGGKGFLMSLFGVGGRFFVFLLVLFLILGFFRPVNAGVGVVAGEFLRYGVSDTVLTGNDTQLIAELKGEAYWINLTVASVSGDSLSTNAVSYNSTYSTGSSTMRFNVVTGETVPGGGQRFFVPANLGFGDQVSFVYPENRTFTLNENSSWMKVMGVWMLTNHVGFDLVNVNANFTGVVANVSAFLDYYWEKGSGVLVGFNYTTSSNRTVNGDLLLLGQSVSLGILSANPLIPEFDSLFYVVFVAVGTVSIVYVSKRWMRSRMSRVKG